MPVVMSIIVNVVKAREGVNLADLLLGGGHDFLRTCPGEKLQQHKALQGEKEAKSNLHEVIEVSS